jgi:hypothetical protein
VEAATRAARFVRLLLDEMHSPTAAVRLRATGVDVVAVSELPPLRGRTDDEVLAWATGDERAVVSENVKDFVSLAVQWSSEDRAHAGIVLTTAKRFPRATAAYPGSLIAALGSFVSDPPVAGRSWVWWLS